MACKWCGSSSDPISHYCDNSCDCDERMKCEKAGQAGHRQCGVLPCGCPVFYFQCTGKCKEDVKESTVR